MMKTKIIILLLILALVGGGIAYFHFFRGEKIPELTDLSEIELPSVSLASDVEIGDLNLDELNIGVSLPSDLFSNISVDTDIAGYQGKINFQQPSVSFDISSLMESFQGASQHPSEGPQVNQQTCAQFKSAPSCSFVPQQYRELCEQCKQKGY